MNNPNKYSPKKPNGLSYSQDFRGGLGNGPKNG